MRKLIYGALATVSILTAVSCATNNKQSQSADNMADSTVLFKEWRLVELEGQAIDTVSTPSVPTIMFTQDGHRVSGNAGCNRMMGSFTLSGTNELKLGPMAATKMACPEMKIEDTYLQTLDKVTNYSIDNGDLLLHHDSKVVAKFIAM
jgi:heat shock protein HslJ